MIIVQNGCILLGCIVLSCSIYLFSVALIRLFTDLCPNISDEVSARQCVCVRMSRRPWQRQQRRTWPELTYFSMHQSPSSCYYFTKYLTQCLPSNTTSALLFCKAIEYFTAPCYAGEKNSLFHKCKLPGKTVQSLKPHFALYNTDLKSLQDFVINVQRP